MRLRASSLAAVVAICATALAWTLVGPTAPAEAQTKTAATSPAVAAIDTNGTAWTALTPAQQTALAPLATAWPTLNSNQKNKWLVLSKNYASLPAPEQGKLQTRMSDWAKLSPQQRAQARLNFAENRALTNGLTPEQRSAQWQAYQLLSPQEKQALAAGSAKPSVGTAARQTPADPLKNSLPAQFGTAKVLERQASQPAATTRKIAVSPHLQNSNSLMPKTTVSSAEIVPGAAGTRP
jgi:Protein of unknown function (DUF3106)